MTKFICEPCNYESHDKSNFLKHNSSKKHKEKMHIQQLETQMQLACNKNETFEHIYKCDFCKGIYATAGSLARHRRSCDVRQNLEIKYQKKFDDLKKENETLKRIYKNDIKHYKETINNLKIENQRLQETLNNAGNIIKSSVSTNNYIIKNFKDAPALAAPDDYSRLTYNRPKNSDTEDEDDELLTDSEECISDDPGDRFLDEPNKSHHKNTYNKDKEKFIEKLVYKHKEKILDDYLGKIIVRHYKKKDPAQQSIFNSDTTRLTYIIRELFSNKKIDWTVDKKGIKTTNYIIRPFLKHIVDLIREYVNQKTKIDRKNVDTEALIANFDNLKFANEILHSIEKNELSESVLKKISPHFYFIKNDSGLLKE